MSVLFLKGTGDSEIKVTSTEDKALLKVLFFFFHARSMSEHRCASVTPCWELASVFFRFFSLPSPIVSMCPIVLQGTRSQSCQQCVSNPFKEDTKPVQLLVCLQSSSRGHEASPVTSVCPFLLKETRSQSNYYCVQSS